MSGMGREREVGLEDVLVDEGRGPPSEDGKAREGGAGAESEIAPRPDRSQQKRSQREDRRAHRVVESEDEEEDGAGDPSPPDARAIGRDGRRRAGRQQRDDHDGACRDEAIGQLDVGEEHVQLREREQCRSRRERGDPGAAREPSEAQVERDEFEAEANQLGDPERLEADAHDRDGEHRQELRSPHPDVPVGEVPGGRHRCMRLDRVRRDEHGACCIRVDELPEFDAVDVSGVPEQCQKRADENDAEPPLAWEAHCSPSRHQRAHATAATTRAPARAGYVRSAWRHHPRAGELRSVGSGWPT